MAYLTDEQRELVSNAVREAELHTSGEIVTVLADRSDGYTDVALWWAIGASFTAMSVFAAFPQPFLDFWDGLSGGWGTEWTIGELASMTIARCHACATVAAAQIPARPTAGENRKGS